MIQLKDVRIEGDVLMIDFLYVTKRSAKGFSFHLPSWLIPTFKEYLSQFPDNSPVESI